MLISCTPDSVDDPVDPATDLHSYGNVSAVRMTHVDLNLDVDFEARQLRGTCTLDVEGEDGDLVLDTRDLAIERVEVAADGGPYREVPFELGEHHEFLGAPLRIERGDASKVRIAYATARDASGLQWLEPRQTAGREQPFLYSQSQAIHARSWIPLQDTPGTRVTYSARVRVPQPLVAVMSAEAVSADRDNGEYAFDLPLAIPSYLIALAVGDLAFESTGQRTGVYAEPSVVKAAAEEFEDTEAMMQTSEALYGPYRWGRYDILVLPPAFPYGGMENPRLTFVSPTTIAGDKSLVSIIAHELAHSWSGNLATNGTWRDFWLNEGFTVYIEERIQEAVYGAERVAMESSLEVQAFKEELQDLDARDQVLHVDLAGRDPGEGFTGVPYVKGAMFLRTIEQQVGREPFDAFLRSYFDEFAFRSVTTGEFEEYLDAQLLSKHPEAKEAIPIQQWLEQPGLPEQRHEYVSNSLEAADAAAGEWYAGTTPARALDTSDWITHHWIRFVRAIPEDAGVERLAELDAAFNLTGESNAEILCEWLLVAIRSDYAAADTALKRFLTTVGRRKFLRPLYAELAESDAGNAKALAIYAEARPGYHPTTVQIFDESLGWTETLSAE